MPTSCKARYGNQVQHYLNKLGAQQVDTIKDSLGTYTGDIVSWVGGMATGALHSGLAILDLFSLLFVTPIVRLLPAARLAHGRGALLRAAAA